ncbi:DIS3-like exonuclease 2 [Sergentomyia squamirostris]
MESNGKNASEPENVRQPLPNVQSLLVRLEELRVDFENNGQDALFSDPAVLASGEETQKDVETSQAVEHTAGEHLRKKRRRRYGRGIKKRNDEQLSEDEQDPGEGTSQRPDGKQNVDELLTAENIVILQLLSMTPDERQEYLLEVGFQRNLLVISGQGERAKLEMNPTIYNALKKNRQNRENNINFYKIRDMLSDRKHSQSRRERTVHKKDHESRRQEKKKGKLKAKKLPADFSDIEQNYLNLMEANKQKNTQDASITQQLMTFAADLIEKKRATLMEGEIRVSTVNFLNAFIANPTGGKDIMLRSFLLRRHAMPGDIVRCLVFKTSVQANEKASTSQGDDDPEETEDTGEELKDERETEEPPEIEERDVGVVIEILEMRHNRLVIGTFEKKNLYQLIPRDIKMPRVRICIYDLMMREMKRNKENLTQFIFLAQISGSSPKDVYGQLVKVVGLAGELESESRAILMANRLCPEPYPDEILTNLPQFDITPDDIKERADLRRTCIFTIDPPTARDLDDAVSCVQLDQDTFEVGVHIADVSHYIPENSILDNILMSRTTSIYLVNTVYHMLPLQMCLNCSLLPGKDRLAFSVFWRMNADGEILEERFTKSIINSCVQLAYNHAQTIIDRSPESLRVEDFPAICSDQYKFTDIVTSVNLLHKLSRKLRSRRFEGGAVKLDQAKISFELDPKSGLPVKFSTEVIRESNELIEEYMLLANITVAREIYKKFPESAVLRCHNPPDVHQFQKLENEFKGIGLTMNLTTTSAIAESLAKAIEAQKNPEAAKTVLHYMMTKPMMRARYFCSGTVEGEEDFKHYLLSIPIYTHFTSPIRRYPDILVHRQLAAVCGKATAPILPPEQIQKIANMCNDQKYNAKLANNDSINLYFMKYLEMKKSLSMRAAVYKVGLYYIDAILVDTGHHIKVTLSQLHVSIVEKSSPQVIEITIKGKKSEKKEKSPPMKLHLSIFSECCVTVSCKKDKLRAKLLFKETLDCVRA